MGVMGCLDSTQISKFWGLCGLWQCDLDLDIFIKVAALYMIFLIPFKLPQLESYSWRYGWLSAERLGLRTTLAPIVLPFFLHEALEIWKSVEHQNCNPLSLIFKSSWIINFRSLKFLKIASSIWGCIYYRRHKLEC